MQFNEGDWILGLWFVEWEGGNWMLTVKRDKEGKWDAEYRFRYYSPESKEPFDDKDRKNFYAIRDIPKEKTAEELRQGFNLLWKKMQGICPGPVTLAEVVPIEGDFDEFLRIMSGVSWCNIRAMKGGEA